MNTRHATFADIPELTRMGRDFWNTTPYSDIALCPDSLAETFMGMISNDLLIVAHDGETVVGAVGAIASPLYANKAVLVGAEMFWWVDPQYRNTGAGKLMLTAIEDAARAAGIERFSMSAFDDIEIDKAASIYSRFGYTPTERSFGKVL